MAQLAAPIRVGLVVAGPWAKLFHAPSFAASPTTTLAGVWVRALADGELCRSSGQRRLRIPVDAGRLEAAPLVPATTRAWLPVAVTP